MKKIKNPVIISLISTILLVTLSIILIANINALNILSNKYFLIIITILIILDVLVIFNIVRKKENKKLQIINTIMCILVSIIMIICTIYIKNTISFMKDITNNNYISDKKQYSVIVLNDNYNSIKDLENKNIGFIKADTLYDENIIEFNKTTKLKFIKNEFDEFDKIVSSLREGKIDAISFDDAHMKLLETNYNDIFNRVKVIYTYYVSNMQIKGENINLEPFILYISGIDTAGDINNVSRSDVNIIVVVNPAKEKILLVNIPRDTYVQLNGTSGTKDKLTHAGIYGIDMSKKTIEDLLGANINYYIKVNFTSLISFVDEIGGIDVYSDKTFKTSNKPYCNIVEGTNRLDGRCALAYSRERYAYETGDIHRGENQQEVIKGIINELSSINSLTNYNNILKSSKDSFKTDMSYDELTNLMKFQLDNMPNWQTESIGLTGVGMLKTTYSMGNIPLYVMEIDEESLNTIKVKINEYLEK